MNPLLQHLPQRAVGLVLLLAAMVAYEPGDSALLQRLFIPLLMATAAVMLVQNVAAVALGALLLAAIHSDLGSPDWVRGQAYPALALLAGAILLAALGRRFRRRIVETREARWAPRRRHADQPPAAGREETGEGSHRSGRT